MNSGAEASRVLVALGKSVRIRGGGTKSALLPPTKSTLSTRCLSGIHTLAPEDMYVTVGTGMRLEEVQEVLRHHRMWAPLVSPWAEATIGGIVATNINAPLRMRYGSIRDMLLAATVALPDGRIARIGRPVVKNVAGYDLPKLYVGSHGTLGLLCDVTLKLTPLPRAGNADRNAATHCTGARHRCNAGTAIPDRFSDTDDPDCTP